MNTYTLLKYVLIGLAVLILGGLGGWYLYLRAQNAAIATTSAGRGFGAVTPSFTGEIGSSHQNALAARGSTTSETVVTKSDAKSVWHVDTAPVAGFGFISAPGTTTALYFVERATGYIYDARPEEGSVRRMTSTLTPKVYEASVALDGSVLQRTINDDGSIQSILIGGLTGTTTNARRSALPRAMNPVATYPGGSMTYGTYDGAQFSLWTSLWDASKAKVVFSSTIAHWRTYMLDSGRIVLAETAASGALGHAYELMKDGSLLPIALPGAGLMVNPQASSSAVLFSTERGNSFQLSLQKDRTLAPITIPLTTIADKCAWGAAAPLNKKGMAIGTTTAYCAVPDRMTPRFIDAWYRGQVHTTDSWWSIDPDSGNTTKLTVDYAGATPPDVVDPQVSPSGTYIAFRDSRDQSLWIIKITQ